MKGFKDVVVYYQQLVPTLILSLKEESTRGAQGAATKSRNDVLVGTLSTVLATLERLLSAITNDEPFAIAIEEAEDDQAEAGRPPARPSLAELIVNLRILYTQVSSKMTNENRSNVTIPELRTANERIMLALGTVVSSLSLIRPLSEERASLFSGLRHLKVRGQQVPTQAQDDWSLETGPERRARSYVDRLRIDSPPSIPYQESLQFRSLISTSTQTQQESAAKIVQLSEKIGALEKQRQDLHLEHSLAQASLAQFEKKVQGMQEELGKTRQSLEQKQVLFEKMQAKKRNVSDASTEPDPAIAFPPVSPPSPGQQRTAFQIASSHDDEESALSKLASTCHPPRHSTFFLSFVRSLKRAIS